MPLLIENKNLDVSVNSYKTDGPHDDFNDGFHSNKMFDEQAASETLLMLSSARCNQKLVTYL